MVKVKILDGDPYWMTHYADADGNVWLDLDEGFSTLLSKEIEQLTLLGKINIEGVLGTSLIATPKNEALIGKPSNIGVLGNQYTDFTVQIIDGMKILNQTKLRINVQKDGNENNYEVEILDTTKHWAVLFNTLYLDELPFNEFEFSSENLWNNFNLANHYDNGEDGYYFPLVNHGTFPNKDTYTEGDFRPWVHVAKVLELAFLNAEWSFSCPLIDTEVGRKLITYILKDTLSEDEDLLNSRKFEGGWRPGWGHLPNSVELQYNVPKKWSIYTIAFPNYFGFYYDGNTGKYSGVIRAKFIAEINMSISVSGKLTKGKTHVVVQIVKEKADGTIIEYGGDAERDWLDDDIDHDDTVTLSKELYVYQGEKVYVRLKMGGLSGGQVNIKTGSRFYNEPIAYIPQSGEKYDVKKQLRHDKVIDYLKGVSHLFNFKFYTNFTEKKVYILTPYDITFFGDAITGFFQTTLQDFTDKIDTNEIEIIVPNEEKNCLVLYLTPVVDSE